MAPITVTIYVGIVILDCEYILKSKQDTFLLSHMQLRRACLYGMLYLCTFHTTKCFQYKLHEEEVDVVHVTPLITPSPEHPLQYAYSFVNAVDKELDSLILNLSKQFFDATNMAYARKNVDVRDEAPYDIDMRACMDFLLMSENDMREMGNRIDSLVNTFSEGKFKMSSMDTTVLTPYLSAPQRLHRDGTLVPIDYDDPLTFDDITEFYVIVHLNKHDSFHKSMNPDSRLIEGTHVVSSSKGNRDCVFESASSVSATYALAPIHSSFVTLHTPYTCHRGIRRNYPVVVILFNRVPNSTCASPYPNCLDEIVANWIDSIKSKA